MPQDKNKQQPNSKLKFVHGYLLDKQKKGQIKDVPKKFDDFQSMLDDSKLNYVHQKMLEDDKVKDVPTEFEDFKQNLGIGSITDQSKKKDQEISSESSLDYWEKFGSEAPSTSQEVSDDQESKQETQFDEDIKDKQVSQDDIGQDIDISQQQNVDKESGEDQEKDINQPQEEVPTSTIKTYEEAQQQLQDFNSRFNEEDFSEDTEEQSVGKRTGAGYGEIHYYEGEPLDKAKYKSKKKSFNEKIDNLEKQGVDKFVNRKSDDIVRNSYGDVTTKTEDLGFEVVDNSAVRDKANEIAKSKGLEEDSHVAKLIQRRASQKINNEILSDENEKEQKNIAKEAGYDDVETYKQEELFSDELTDAIAKSTTDLEEEKKNVMIEYGDKAKKDINEQVSPILEEVDGIKQEYDNKVDQAKQKKQKLDNSLASGDIQREKYNQKIQEINDNLKQYYQTTKEELSQKQEKIVDIHNKVNQKWSENFEKEMNSLINSHNQRISDNLPKGTSKKDLRKETVDNLKEFYQQASSNVADKREESKVKLYSNVPTPLVYYAKTTDKLGNALAGFGNSLGSEGLEQWGETLTEKFKPPKSWSKNKDWSDLLDPHKRAAILGEFTGGTLPSLTAAGLTSAATGMGGAPVAAQLLASSMASFFGETAQTAGNMRRDVFEETGDIQEANAKASRVVDGQLAISYMYLLDGLPFVPKALSKLGSISAKTTLRAGIGAGTEWLTELGQEIPQSGFEQAIRNNEALSDGLKEIMSDGQKLKDIAIATAPTTLLGGAPQVVTGMSEGAQAQAYAESLNIKKNFANVLTDLKQQGINKMVESKGEGFAKSVMSRMYAQGLISKEELKARNETITDIKKHKKAAKDLDLKKHKEQHYVGLKIKEQEINERLSNADDSNVVERLQNDKKAVQTEISNLTEGNDANVIAIETPDGNVSSYMTHREFQRAVKNNDDFATQIGKNKISVQQIGEANEETSNLIQGEFDRQEDLEKVEEEQQQAEETGMTEEPYYEINGKPFPDKESFLEAARQERDANQPVSIKTRNDPQSRDEAIDIIKSREASEKTEQTEEQTEQAFQSEEEGVWVEVREGEPTAVDREGTPYVNQETGKTKRAIRQWHDQQERDQEQGQESKVPDELSGHEIITSVSEKGEIKNIKTKKKGKKKKSQDRQKVGSEKIQAEITLETEGGTITIDEEVETSALMPRKPSRSALRREARDQGLNEDAYIERKMNEYDREVEKAIDNSEGMVFETKNGNVYTIQKENGVNKAKVLRPNGTWADTSFNLENSYSRSVFAEKMEKSSILSDEDVTNRIEQRQQKQFRLSEDDKRGRSEAANKITQMENKKLKPFKILKEITSNSKQKLSQAVNESLGALAEHIKSNGFENKRLAIDEAKKAFENTDWYQNVDEKASVSQLFEQIASRRYDNGHQEYKVQWRGNNPKANWKQFQKDFQALKKGLDPQKGVGKLLKDIEEKVLNVINDDELTVNQKKEKLIRQYSEHVDKQGMDEFVSVFNDFQDFEKMTETEAKQIFDHYKEVAKGQKSIAQGKYSDHQQNIKKFAEEWAMNATNLTDKEVRTNVLNRDRIRDIAKTLKKFFTGKKIEYKGDSFLQAIRGFLQGHDYHLKTVLNILNSQRATDSNGNTMEDAFEEMIEDAYNEELRMKQQDEDRWLSLFAEKFGASVNGLTNLTKRLQEIRDTEQEVGQSNRLRDERRRVFNEYEHRKTILKHELKEKTFKLFNETMEVGDETIRFDEAMTYLMWYDQEVSRQTLQQRHGIWSNQDLKESFREEARNKGKEDVEGYAEEKMQKESEQDIDRIRNALDTFDPAVREWMNVMNGLIQSKGDQAAEVFEKVTGREMPRAENYFTIIRDKENPHGEIENTFTDEATANTQVSQGINTFLSKIFTDRVPNNEPLLLKSQPDEKGKRINIGYFNVLDKYVMDINHFVNFAEMSQKMNKFMQEPRIKLMTRKIFGSSGYKNTLFLMRAALNQHYLNEETIENVSKELRSVKSGINKVLYSQLMMKPKFILQQAGSFPMAQPEAPGNYAEFMQNVVKYAANPKLNKELLAELKADFPLFYDRITNMKLDNPDLTSSLYKNAGLAINDQQVSRTSIKGRALQTENSIKYVGGKPILLGDAQGVALGYGVAYKMAKEKYGKEYAKKVFLKYESTQQTRTNFYLNKAQIKRRNAKGFGEWLINTAFTAYQSVPKLYLNQQIASAYNITRDAKKGGYKNIKKKDVNKFLHAYMAGNASYTIVQNLGGLAQWAVTGDSDLLDKFYRNGWKYALTGNGGTIWLFGEIAKLISTVSYEALFNPDSEEVLDDTVNRLQARLYGEEDLGVAPMEDIKQAISVSLTNIKEDKYDEAMLPLLELIVASRGIGGTQLKDIANVLEEPVKDVGKDAAQLSKHALVTEGDLYNEVLEYYGDNLTISDKRQALKDIFKIAGWSDYVISGGKSKEERNKDKGTSLGDDPIRSANID